MAIAHARPGNHPALLSYGFRPFFLLGSLQGGLAVLVWLPMLSGHLETQSLLIPVDWHVHELLFGFLPAIVAGFLLTAIPNWTGRLPVQGLPLGLLAGLWLAGRLAIFFSAHIGWLAALAIDAAFLPAISAVAAVEISAGRNWRNLRVLAPVLLLFAANVAFHVEAHLHGVSDVSRRLGLAAILVLIMLVGGRIVPSFTRNWLVRENPGRLPVPFDRFDAVAILAACVALGLWSFLPYEPAIGVLLIAAGFAHFARLARWAGWRTAREPLVLMLHVAYAFVPAGFLVSGAGALAPEAVPPVAGIHVFAVGAVGAMTLAVMTRAALGHTGRELAADAATCAIFAAIAAAVPLRLTSVFLPEMPALLHLSATLWAAAFLGYALRYGPILVAPRPGPAEKR